jgi:arsenate reductase (thioredoxin)
MAEGFARAYGSDVLVVRSAGLAPALAVAPLSHRVMLEKNIDLGDCYPKQFDPAERNVDLIVNMSGHDLPPFPGVEMEVWEVLDPIGESEQVFCQVRDQIEARVRQLIEKLRSRKPAASEAIAGASPSASKVDTRRRPTRQ